jgi:transposase
VNGAIGLDRSEVGAGRAASAHKPRGVARVDDRRVLNTSFYVLRTGSPRRDLPERCGPYMTGPISAKIDGPGRAVAAGLRGSRGRFASINALIDSSTVRAHQHAPGGKKGARITPSAILVETDQQDPCRRR